jgi:hypothetical protein
MDKEHWDAELMRLGGHLLQSWGRGEAKRLQGWRIERLSRQTAVYSWMVQVLIKSHGPISIAYLPNGPVTAGDHIAAFEDLQCELERVCRRAHAVSLVIEPTQLPGLDSTLAANRYAPRERSIQPRRTFTVVVGEDHVMLQAMHHKTRYHVRLAERQGVIASWHRPDDASMRAFLDLHNDTVRRNRIAPLSRSYFHAVCEAFGQDVEIVIGEVDGVPVAAAIVVWFGKQAHYLFAGSSTARRGQGAGALVVFRTLQRARDRGCEGLDLGSIESDGLRTFKTGFHGYEVVYLPSMERRFQPAIAWLLWRAVSARSAMNREALSERAVTWARSAKGVVGRPLLVR